MNEWILMRIAATILWLLIPLLVVPGCRSSRRGDLVEAELRTKERQLREANSELERTRLVNESLEREFLQRKGGASGTDTSVLSPKSIVLANGTGGVNDDRQPGDEAFQVVVVPKDEDGNPVRALGTLMVSVWEIMPGGVKVPLNTWDVSALDLRRTWKSGLLGSGYHVVLHWKKLPRQERLRVAVQFTTPNGQVYETDKDITIKLMAEPPPLDRIPPLPLDEGPTVPIMPTLLPPRPSSYGD
ncbi:MAG: hypothetical protein K8T89_05595 [Planctomycetes bacterium]|nr:hypothetical protein [Planctomycetota bacterium]